MLDVEELYLDIYTVFALVFACCNVMIRSIIINQSDNLFYMNCILSPGFLEHRIFEMKLPMLYWDEGAQPRQQECRGKGNEAEKTTVHY